MGTKNNNAQELLCVNAEKVYDWILGESTGSTSIPVAALPIPISAGSINLEVNGILTDVNGTPIQDNVAIDIEEVTPRQDRQFEVNGELVTLQRVVFRKAHYVVLEISGVDPDTGTPFMITSNPTPFNFIETAFLLAPRYIRIRNIRKSNTKLL